MTSLTGEGVVRKRGEPRPSTNWHFQACDLLEDGYGVEDIALMLSEGLERVRSLVSAMRNSGKLTGMFPRFSPSTQGGEA